MGLTIIPCLSYPGFETEKVWKWPLNVLRLGKFERVFSEGARVFSEDDGIFRAPHSTKRKITTPIHYFYSGHNLHCWQVSLQSFWIKFIPQRADGMIPQRNPRASAQSAKGHVPTQGLTVPLSSSTVAALATPAMRSTRSSATITISRTMLIVLILISVKSETGAFYTGMKDADAIWHRDLQVSS